MKKYKLNERNVLVIGDLHEPFGRSGVIQWLKRIQRKYNCGTVVFIGDIIDGHAWSYHEHNPDGMSVKDELQAAKNKLKFWYKAFPKATVCLGNHDLLISRKALSHGLSQHFIKDLGQLLDAPKEWNFVIQYKKDNVLYTHGTTTEAFKAALQSRLSTVQGHFHSLTYVQWSVSERDAIFGMQVGWCGDRHAYAFEYGKNLTKKPIISCGVILDRGRTPIVELMKF